MKKVFIKIITLVMAMAMLLSFAACGKKTTTEEDGPASATPKPQPDNIVASIKLSGYTFYDGCDNLERYKNAYNADYPGVEVTIDRDDITSEVYFDAIDDILYGDGTAEVNYDALGDVILLDSARMTKLAEEGKLVDLSEYIDDLMNYQSFKKVNPSTDLLKAAHEASLYDGQMYMCPIEYNHKFVFLNYSLLEANGFSFPSDDWTWKDILAMAETLKGAGVTNPIVMDYSDYTVWGSFARSYGKEIYDFIGNSTTKKELNLTAPAVVQGLTDLADFANPAKGLVVCKDASELTVKDLEESAFIIADHEDITRWEEDLKAESCPFTWDYIHFPRWNDANYAENKTYYQSIGTNVYGFAVVDHGKNETYDDEFYRACAILALYGLMPEAAEAYCKDGEAVPANKVANELKFWREYPVDGKNSSVFSNFAETADFSGNLSCFMPVMSESEIDIMKAFTAYWAGTPMIESLQTLQDNAIISWID